MTLRTVVGCPVWDRSWCLDAWFDCVEANVNPAETGLVFVVPSHDEASRDVIRRRSAPFRVTEVHRDRGEQLGRGERSRENHKTLAVARNMILHTVNEMKPEIFVSWDSDFFVPAGTVSELQRHHAGVVGVWGWLNRQPPLVGRFDGESIVWQPAMAATVMEWVYGAQRQRARSIAPSRWDDFVRSILDVDVVLAFQVMRPEAYKFAQYGQHPDDENIPFFSSLARRGVRVRCVGSVVGVHLYNKNVVEPRTWPELMELDQQKPLAAVYLAADTRMAAMGFIPKG